MRNLLASIFRLLFRIGPIRHFYFAIDKKIFKPLKVFKGVTKNILYRDTFRMNVRLDDWIPQQLYFLGSYEEKEILFVSKALHPGDIFLDIGANIGIFTMVASKLVGEAGKVYSFEPMSANFEKLSRHVSVNKLDNVICERLAVLHRNEQVSLFIDDLWNNDSMATAYPETFNHREYVEGISLDNYFEDDDLGMLRLIKLDIEGGEFPALIGMKDLLKKYHPVILIEMDSEILKRTSHSQHDIEEFLSSFEYIKKYIGNSGEVTNERSPDDNSYNYVFV